MKNEEILIKNLNSAIDDIFISIASNDLSTDSNLFKAAASAKMLLNQPVEKFKLVDQSEFFSNTKSSMFDHCIEVTNLILNKHYSYSKACKEIANQAKISIPSVNQACCRGQKINGNQKLRAYHWNHMAEGDFSTKEYIFKVLLERYPFKKEIIEKIFNIVK